MAPFRTNQYNEFLALVGGPCADNPPSITAGKKRSRQLEGVLLMKVYTSNIFLTMRKRLIIQAKSAFHLEDTYR